MGAFSIVQDVISSRFPFQIGKELGYGAQGQVFEIKDNSNRVIKFSIMYENFEGESLPLIYNKIEKVYNFIIKNNPEPLVKVFDFGHLMSGARKTVAGQQQYIVYYSVMEKLWSLTDDEKKVFKTVCQALNYELELKRPVSEIVQELRGWYSFDEKKVLQFYDYVTKCAVNQNDFHRRNILKDNNGNFKLIDFDLAELGDYNGKAS